MLRDHCIQVINVDARFMLTANGLEQIGSVMGHYGGKILHMVVKIQQLSRAIQFFFFVCFLTVEDFNTYFQFIQQFQAK